MLSVMMFMEYAIWGAWSPVLASRLLGPLKMTGKQTGWIYGTIPLASIIAPLFAGQIADRWVATQWVLLVAHAIGGLLLFVAARRKTFGPLFGVMGLYALCYAATIPLVNSLMFVQLEKHCASSAQVTTTSTSIFLWAPIAWVLAGWALTGWRMKKGTGDGSDCLILAGILSLIMAVFCAFLPDTPPQGVPGAALPFIKAFDMLSETNFLIFIILSLIVTTQIWFYYLGTAPYLQDIGVQSKNIPAVMSIAQVAQAIFTWKVFEHCLSNWDFRWILGGGAFCWLLMYLIYSLQKPKSLIIGSMALHGIAYVLFMIGGQVYVNTVAPADIKSSAQALIIVVTVGLGSFLGTQFTGVVMDRLKVQDKFRWSTIFLVPCLLTLLCVAAFVLFFKG